MAPKGAPAKMKPVGQAYKDKSKPADVRSSNINAAKGIYLNGNCLVKATWNSLEMYLTQRV